MISDDPDSFASEAQGDLFGPAAVPPAYRPDPDKVRSRLHKILAEARAAQTLTWEPTTVSLYRTIFPQMAHWLPRRRMRAIVLRVRNGIGALADGITTTTPQLPPL